MRVVTDRDTLLRLAAAVARPCDPKATIPILSHLRLTAEGAALRLEGTDLDRSFTAEAPAEVAEGGAVAVDARALVERLKVAPKGRIVLAAAPPPPPAPPALTEIAKHAQGCAACAAWEAAPKKGAAPPTCAAGEAARKVKAAPAPAPAWPALTLTTSNGARVEVPTVPARDFPALPAIPALEPVGDPATLRRMLAQIAPTMSTDETRYHLHGALFHAPGDRFVLVSTDGHRMTKATADRAALGLAPLKEERLVPRAAVLDLLAMISKPTKRAPASAVALGWMEKPGAGGPKAPPVRYFAARVDDVTMIARLTDAQFPPHEQVIPRDFERGFRADRAELLAALEQVKGGASSKTWGITLGLHTGALRLRAADPDKGTTVLDLPVEYTGAPFVFGVCAVYLIELLKAQAGKVARLGFNGTLDPAGTVSGDLTQVVMPMRFDDNRGPVDYSRPAILALLPPAAERQPALPAEAAPAPAEAARPPRAEKAPAKARGKAPAAAKAAPAAAEADLLAACAAAAGRPVETRAEALAWLQAQAEARKAAEAAPAPAEALQAAPEALPAYTGPRLVYSAPRVPGLRERPAAPRKPVARKAAKVAARRPAASEPARRPAKAAKVAAPYDPAAETWDW